MLKELVKVANKLDSLGLTKEADVVDGLINKMAARVINPGDYDYDMVAELGGEDWDSDTEHPHADFLNKWEKEDPSIRNIITNTEHESYDPDKHDISSYEMDEDSEETMYTGHSPEQDLVNRLSAAKKLESMSDEEFQKLMEEHPEVMRAIFGSGSLHEVRR
jgi:hypothetical protein